MAMQKRDFAYRQALYLPSGQFLKLSDSNPLFN